MPAHYECQFCFRFFISDDTVRPVCPFCGKENDPATAAATAQATIW